MKTKQLLRTKVWFPNIDKLVEEDMRSCIPCQAVTNPKVREPLQMTELPAVSWQKVAADFKGPLRDGQYLLVVVNMYSRYPFVKKVTSTSAMAVILKLDELFAEQCIPVTLTTDNGPPFNSSEFKRFAEYLGFKHHRITPLWPQANGEVERVMRTLNKAIQTASVEGNPIMRVITEFLRNYRELACHHILRLARHPLSCYSNACIKTRLPVYTPPEQDDQLRAKDAAQKAKMKSYADSKQTKSSTINVGDTVLVRQERRNKTTPPFDPLVPYVVERRKGTQVTARRPGHLISRNVSFFKQIPKRSPSLENEENGDHDDTLPDGYEQRDMHQTEQGTNQMGPEVTQRRCLKSHKRDV